LEGGTLSWFYPSKKQQVLALSRNLLQVMDMKKMISFVLALMMLLSLPAQAMGGVGRVMLADDAQTHNALLAAAAIDGLQLPFGATFSFNDIVGPRTESAGYVPALNGRGVEVVGGGCAQVASALWLMIKDSPDFAVVEKATYGANYNQTYVASADDAVCVDYGSGQDFVFRYVGPGAVTLYAAVEDGVLKVSFER
jgi:vancomycin resistance protein YoaR